MSALRSFKGFGKTAPFQPTIQIDPTGTITTPVSFPCNLVNFDGFVAAGSCWLQIFDSTTSPAPAAVPLMSIEVDNVGPTPSFLPSLGPITLYKGLYIALSSTGPTYTAVATNFSIWGAIEEFELMQTEALSVAGDLTTGVDDLTVWLNSAGPKRLVQLDVIINDGTSKWLLIFARDTGQVITTEKPILSIPLLVTTVQQTFKFGRDGMDVRSQGPDYTQYKGCYVSVGSLPFVVQTNLSSNNIRAYYK